jgi:secreted trypsin-like serine protease
MLARAFFVALAVLAVHASIPQKNFDIAPNIVNGSDTTIEEFPFMASLQWEFNSTTWLHYCGGTILHERWVLTAGRTMMMMVVVTTHPN